MADKRFPCAVLTIAGVIMLILSAVGSFSVISAHERHLASLSERGYYLVTNGELDYEDAFFDRYASLCCIAALAGGALITISVIPRKMDIFAKILLVPFCAVLGLAVCFTEAACYSDIDAYSPESKLVSSDDGGHTLLVRDGSFLRDGHSYIYYYDGKYACYIDSYNWDDRGYYRNGIRYDKPPRYYISDENGETTVTVKWQDSKEYTKTLNIN